MKSKIKIVMKRIGMLLLAGLIYLGIGYVLALLIMNHSNSKIEDILSYEGIILVIIGILLSMKGELPGSSYLNDLSSKNIKALLYKNFDASFQEDEDKPYNKKFSKNNPLRFDFVSLSFIAGGVIIIAAIYIFFI